MSAWVVKKGNTSIQEVPVYDKNGDVVTNLADASEIRFQVKEHSEDATPKIDLGYGISGMEGIEVNQPSQGTLRLTVSSLDSNIDVNQYKMGLQIKWPGDPPLVYECDLEIDGVETDIFEIEEDVVS